MKKKSIEEMSEDEVIKALQEGKIGQIAHLILMCHDLKNRNKEKRKNELGKAYQEMVDICPGLMTSQSSIFIDDEGKTDSVTMHIRFLYSSDIDVYRTECVKILHLYGFDA